MSNSLIVTFDELVDNLGNDSYSVTVNGQLRVLDYLDVEGIYSSYLSTNDVVTITIETAVPGALKTINVIRRDYTTDDINGDSGIRDTFVSSSAGYIGFTYSTTFTATTIASCYNYEYRISLSTGENSLCQIIGDASGAPLLNPIIEDDLVIYTNGNTFTGGTNNTNVFWYDNQGNFNGRSANKSTSVWKPFDTGFFEISNNYSIRFSGASSPTYSIPSTGVSFTFGGWIQTVQTSTDVSIFSAGSALNLYKNSSNYWAASVRNGNSFGNAYTYATSSTLLNPDSNIWNYVMCKWTTGDGLKLYLNGVLIASTSTTETELYGESYFSINSAILNISNFQCYYRALTDSEILYNFNQLKSYYGY
jgi:hypothetical protein